MKIIDKTLISIIVVIAFIYFLPTHIEVAAIPTNSIYFETITIDNGLSSNNVTSIIQDSYGYIWFGTSKGLNKYDGINFDIYHDNPINNDISDSSINSLYITDDETLWIGTNWGLNKFDRVTNTFITYLNEQDNSNSISDNFITSICEDSDGYLWIGTKNGVNKLDSVTETFTLYLNNQNDSNSISDNYITSIYEDSDGYLWIGTINGLSKLDRESGEFISYRSNIEKTGNISNNYITCIYEDNRNQLWVGTINGLNKFNRESEYFTFYLNNVNNINSLSNNYVTSICEDLNGYLWIGTRLGVNKLDMDTGMFYVYRYNSDDPFSLSYDRIQALYRDNEGDLWIGTLNGINKINFKKQSFKYYIDELYNNAVPDIAGINGKTIWLKTRYGLIKFNNESKSVEKVYDEVFINQNYSSAKINTFCISIDGCLWAGTESVGLEKFDPVTEKITSYRYDPENENSLPSDTILSLCASDNDFILWIGTTQGLCSFNIKTEEFYRYYDNASFSNSVYDEEIWLIYQTSNGDLWISADSGFYRVNEENNYMNCIIDNSQLTGSHYTKMMSDIFEGSKGLLWFANENTLFCYDIEGNNFVKTGLESYFTNISIQSILEDSNNDIWLATTYNGLLKISRNYGDIHQYGEDDGISNTLFCYRSNYIAEDGELFFGCVAGLISFYPDEIIEDNNVPTVVINNFELLNKQISFDEPIEVIEEIKLSYNDNSFNIDFIAFNYDSPLDNRYVYMLDGFDENWHYCDASNSYTKYTNIPPGEYIFRVKASNSDDIWNEEGASLKIVISAPFWQQWWFIAGMIAIVMMSVYTVIKLRTYTLQKYSQKLEYNFEEKTHQLVQRSEQLENELNKRAEFTRALAHELKTPLTPLLSSSEFLMNTVENDITLGFINNIRQGVLNLDKRINELMDLAKGEVGLIKLHCEYIYSLNFIKDSITYFIPEAQKKGQSLILDVPESLPKIYADSERIRQVILNLLNNASKFTRKNGEIILKAREEKDNITIEVIDTGCGIAQAELEHIFEPYNKLKLKKESLSGLGLGLYLAKLFIELHGGQIWVISSKGQGSTFAFSLPIQHNNDIECYDDVLKMI